MIEIYTDGACSGNPGPGGWGVLIIDAAGETELFGGERDTTNNRMEMMAVVEALQATACAPAIKIYTDSQYVKNGITTWIHGWKRNGWKTAAKKPVKNEDLWRELDDEVARHKVNWHWVKGHSGNPDNELADELANRGVEELANAG